LTSKSIVLAITKNDVNAAPTTFGTYDISSDFPACTIWEIGRATSAAPTFYKSIKLGRDNIDFVDPGLGYNNPCETLIAEATKLYPTAKEMRILSIGTGFRGPVSIRNTRRSIINALKNIGTDSSKVAARLEEKFRGTAQYYRFDVEFGLQDITLADWRMDSRISTHTHNYIERKKTEIHKFVKSLSDDGASSKIDCEPCAKQHTEDRPSSISTPKIAQHHLSIIRNTASQNAEQSNIISKVPDGRTAQISDNRSMNGSKQWNSIMYWHDAWHDETFPSTKMLTLK